MKAKLHIRKKNTRKIGETNYLPFHSLTLSNHKSSQRPEDRLLTTCH
jgi:hypothetical protein